MNFQNCPKCGKLFNSTASYVCDECRKKEEEKFEEVRLFVKENPDVSISTISKETKVSVGKILGYVRDGRIEISMGSEDALTCEKCGKGIVTGRFCVSCANRISEDVMSHLNEDVASRTRGNNARMFTRDSKSK